MYLLTLALVCFGSLGAWAKINESSCSSLLDLYYRDISARYEAQSNDQLWELIWKGKNGDIDARNKLVESCLPFATKVARGYYVEGGLALEDLIQSASLGILDAFYAYDLNLKSPFLPFARWAIRSRIIRAFGENNLIYVPGYLRKLIREWYQTEENLMMSLGRIPTDEEILEQMPVSQIRRPKLFAALLAFRKAMELVPEEFLEKFRDGQLEAPEKGEYLDRLRELFSSMNGILDERERVILTHRYGLDGRSPMSLEEVSSIVGLTRERVRQLQKEAEQKLATYIAR